jgi:mannosyltransferase
VKRHQYILGPVFVLALVIRAAIAYRGGIWADEGFFLSIVDLQSWAAMVGFLQYHESHPPLFYGLMRIWRNTAGSDDATTLVLPVILGAALAPVTFGAARKLYSERAALFAAVLVAICSGLAEYSAQIRPYCLLPILVVLSCTSLARLLHTARPRDGLFYAIFTVLLLYTHNWSWLVLGGQGIACVRELFLMPNVTRRRVVLVLSASWAGVALAFLPWLPTFLFQVSHAGHQPVYLPTFIDKLGAAVFALVLGPQMMLLGTLPKDIKLFVTISAVLAAVSALIVARYPRWRTAGTATASGPAGRIATRVFLTIPFVCIVAAGLAASRTDLLIGWCLVMLAPLVLMVFASWVVAGISSAERTQNLAPTAVSLSVLLMAMFCLSIGSVLSAPRSNSREAARALALQLHPSDLVIIVPEWYAPAFNHYFPASVDQIDYPYPGRASTIDFSHVGERMLDTAPLRRLVQQIRDASDSERRIWLVTGPKHLRALSAQEMANAQRTGHTSLTLTYRIAQIRRELIRNYGMPDRSKTPHGPAPRYHEVLLELYSPTPER